jgi:kynurenine formamidase
MRENFQIVDMTHTVSDEVPAWDGQPLFKLDITTDYKDCVPPDLFRIQKFTMAMSVGTHLDAPAHVIPNGRTIDQLTAAELVSDCVVINVSAQANEHYLVTTSDIDNFEKLHGEIPRDSLVIIYTGWSKHWDKPARYHNNHVFPGVSVEAAEMLLTRGIRGIGIDTFSCDTGANGFPVHNAVLGADKYLVENIANADKLPPSGATVFVLPMKLKHATEAPMRLVASIP